MFDEDNAASCIYYTYNPIDVKRWQDDENATAESYYDIYKVTLDGGKATEKKVVSGVGIVNDETVTGELIGLTFDLLRHKNGKIYYTETTLNTAIGSVKYNVLTDADDKTETLTYATTKTTAAFADTVLFYNEGENLVTIYVDSSLGLVKFDYKKAADTTSGSDFGVVAVSDEEALKTATLKFISHEGDVDFLYYTNSDGNYYKINLTALLKGEKAEALRINTLSLNTSWYTPEVVNANGKYFFLCVYSDSAYKSYVYAIDMAEIANGVKAVKEEKGDDFAESDYYSYNKKKDEDKVKIGTRLGVMSEKDAETESSTAK